MNGISVVICCYNSAALIEENLSCFKEQEMVDFPWEIIIVNNNSTDNTIELVNQFKELNNDINIIITEEKTPGQSFARIKGVDIANYDVISFIDDDNFVPKNWITYLGKSFKKNEIGILGVTAIGDFPDKPSSWFEKHQNSFAVGQLYGLKFGEITQSGAVYGAGMSLRKEIYKSLANKNWEKLISGRIGSNQISGDDSELCYAARLIEYKIFYSNEIKIKHHLNKERISKNRLVNLTKAFGISDVYLLAYEIAYRKKINQPKGLDGIRHLWWVNYIGKKVALLKLKLYHSLNKINHFDFEILKIRNQAFCKEIIKNKTGFANSFISVKKLTS